jgi:hypothetical protein
MALLASRASASGLISTKNRWYFAFCFGTQLAADCPSAFDL